MVKIAGTKKAVIIPYQKDYSGCNKVITDYGTTRKQAQKTKVVEMYKPMIEKKAAEAASALGISAIDYAQDLYVRLLENLDSFINQEEPARLLTQLMHKIASEKDDNISTANMPFEKIPNKEKEKMVYNQVNIENQIDFPPIIQQIEDCLTKREFYILSEKASGKSYDKIAETLNISRQRTGEIARLAIKRILHDIGSVLTPELIYDDNKTKIPVIPADKPLFPVVRKGQARSDIDISSLIKYGEGADKIRELTKNDYDHPNYWGTLDILLRTQFKTYPRILYDKKQQDKIISILKEKPNYKIRLSLPRDTKTTMFIPEAKKISTDIFGENIFEFYQCGKLIKI